MFTLGVQYGLVLTFLVGPIFFALLQTGVEQGFRAGFAVGCGVWLSDLTYLLVIYFSLSLIQQVIDSPNFAFYLGMVGSTVLIAFGLSSLLTRPSMKMRPRAKPVRSSSYPRLLTRGALLNAVNPFTILFWVGVISSVFIGSDATDRQAFSFFAGLILTIMCTDMLKVLLAKRIRRWLSLRHLLWIRRITGLILVGFGVALAVRVMMG